MADKIVKKDIKQVLACTKKVDGQRIACENYSSYYGMVTEGGLVYVKCSG